MESAAVPAPLARRLGEDGTEGLLALLHATRGEWTETMVAAAVDRFDRRLTEELSALRVEMTRELASVRVDVGREIGSLRAEVGRDIGALRADLGAARAEQLKWSFVFWIGQVMAVAGIVTLLVRTLGP